MNAFKNIFAPSLGTDYDFSAFGADKLKTDISRRGRWVAPRPPAAGAAPAGGEQKKPAAAAAPVVEEESEMAREYSEKKMNLLPEDEPVHGTSTTRSCWWGRQRPRASSTHADRAAEGGGVPGVEGKILMGKEHHDEEGAAGPANADPEKRDQADAAPAVP
eukprot:Sspe_Gene.26593::Locus_11118_Transcript_4_4_Confidence_0.400_Length_1058::g.26593::m.26593